MDLQRISGLPGWILHRLFASYWLLAVCAVLAALPFALAVLWLDRELTTEWLLTRDLATVATADTAKDFTGVAAGVNAAFITLYFSITLIVLSMAAGNLGARLIDRWIERPLVRVSLAGLSFSMIVSLVAMLATDAEADLADTPLLLVGVVALLQAINVAMLSVSLHDLGRTMFVDTSIDRLCVDACKRSIDLEPVERSARSEHVVLRAPREGYFEDIDLAKLRDIACDGRAVTLHVAPGQHVLKGEPILCSPSDMDKNQVKSAIAIGPYRSDAQGPVFRIRLLVEIAARALSPAINDFYTAIACADKLAAVMESQVDSWIDDDRDPALKGCPELVLLGQDFRGLFEDPMSAFRQAACQYPSVSIRMIDNYGRIAARIEREDGPAQLVDFIRDLARHLRDHADSVTQYGMDKRSINAAFDNGFGDGKTAGGHA
ncbi:DUF2254 family protein [Altererythrobacter sp. MTPC7]|uniref:DUF2254 family protein n=1 Tax=Altererythrobacter sp. MTPC7 TaxID=3056567 RepID=UPI0036F35ACB